MSARNRADAFARALDFEHRYRIAAAERTEPFRWGTAYFNPNFPLIWDLNFLAVDRPAADITVEGLIAEMEALQSAAGLDHRKAAVDDEGLGTALARGFRQREWLVQRMLFMALLGPPARPLDTTGAREISRRQHKTAHIAITRESPYGRDEATVRQLVDKDDLILDAAGGRLFGAEADGHIVSVCQLYSDGATAQIEDVATLEAYRKRGLSRAVMSLAIAEARTAGHDLIFLVADDEDWPKDFYGRLGFEAVGRTYDFVRPADITYSNRE